MSSTNYIITSDTVSVGGGRSTSDNFIVEDTIGEAATGEAMSSDNYGLCAGFQCLGEGAYLSFDITTGTSCPGVGIGDVALGALTTAAVKSSDGAAVNSICLTAESSASGGTVITVRDATSGLHSALASHTIGSATLSPLNAGVGAFGICVYSNSNLDKEPPYDSACDYDTHNIGVVSPTNRPILTAASDFTNGAAEILVKASASTTTPAAADYTDNLTFILTSTY
jgi:hypothetical protein